MQTKPKAFDPLSALFDVPDPVRESPPGDSHPTQAAAMLPPEEPAPSASTRPPAPPPAPAAPAAPVEATKPRQAKAAAKKKAAGKRR